MVSHHRQSVMQADTFVYEPFSRVGPRKKKRKGKTQREISTALDLLSGAKQDLAADGTWLSDCEGKGGGNWRWHLRFALYDTRIRPRMVLCLGLGSPTSSRDARAQLALLCRLCTLTETDSTNVLLYDPVFTDADRQLFRLLGMQCVHNKEVVVSPAAGDVLC
ncbi:hypothetical protein ID866_8036 [Astraeus odoratus]|nr:hypothetical protein ID866_8036 [Astraeus odoratus]